MGIPDEPFWVPDDVLEYYREAGRRGSTGSHRLGTAERTPRSAGREAEWEATMSARPWAPTGPPTCPCSVRRTPPPPGLANQKVLAVVDRHVPGVLGGSADLTGNTGTKLPEAEALEPEPRGGRQVHYGIREHAMGSALVGAALHGGVLPDLRARSSCSPTTCVPRYA